MPENKRLLPILLVLTAGCATEQQAVFVNLDAAVASETLPVPPTDVTPDQPMLMEGTTLAFPPLAKKTLRLQDTQERIRHVQEVIQRSREQAFRELTSRLRQTYLNEIKQIEAERLAALDPAHREALTAAFSKIRAQFESYADRRGPLVVRLALLAGFPDPDPQSVRPPNADTKWARDRFEEAKSLRAQIAELDRLYDRGVQGLFDEPNIARNEEITKIRVQIEEMRNAADERARTEAAQQVQREQEELRSALADKREVTLPAIPGGSVAVPGSAKIVPPPTVEGLGKDELLARLRNTIEADIEIWAAQRDYLLVKTGQDKTKEFIEWRRGRHAGP